MYLIFPLGSILEVLVLFIYFSEHASSPPLFFPLIPIIEQLLKAAVVLWDKYSPVMSDQPHIPNGKGKKKEKKSPNKPACMELC